MRRRNFIRLIGGAAAWPVVARAQQPPLPVIGLINAGARETAAYRVAAFQQGLRDLGFIEGRDVTIEYRWAEGRYALMPDLIADLLRHRPAVIATPGSTAAALAAKAATSDVPIVFSVGEDPVRLGLIASLARPGGNATGINFFTAELSAKRLGLLREMVPRTARVAFLVNPTNTANAESTLKDVEAASSTAAVTLQVYRAATRQEIDAAFAAWCASTPMRFSLPATASSIAAEYNCRCWRSVMAFPRRTRYAIMLRSEG
jgi:putative ABC transport system substrate-binding protein